VSITHLGALVGEWLGEAVKAHPDKSSHADLYRRGGTWRCSLTITIDSDEPVVPAFVVYGYHASTDPEIAVLGAMMQAAGHKQW
jgi:hypothetical protein